jgi:hypothetical protein
MSTPDRDQAAETPEERRRRLAEVFGEVLPETTSDERDASADRGEHSEEWLLAQRPPHHG